MNRRSIPLLLSLLLLPAVAHASPSQFEELRSHGLLFAYLGVFAAGVLTSLTPCVYPMITITVGIFGAKEASSRWRAFGLAAMYVLGMVVMYSGLGVVFALSGRASGSGFLLANPVVVIPIVVLYVVLAASMFGAFELNLPPSLQARLSGVGGKGTLGAFLMGLVGGLTAAPCTGPMLAGLLAFIATTRSVPLGLTFMSTYAVGMGLLFLLIATFALSLPKSGAWMELVKGIGGVALLVVGFYFLRPIWPALARLTSTSMAFVAVGAVMVASGFVLGWMFLRRRTNVWKGAAIVLTTVGAMGCLNWYLTPKKPLSWRRDQPAALAEARASGMPALLDFSAEWCEPCKKFETDVFSDPAVHAELEQRYVPVKYDVTNDDDDDRAHKEQWNAASLPTVILVDKDGREARRFQELPSRDEFLTAIRAVR